MNKVILIQTWPEVAHSIEIKRWCAENGVDARYLGFGGWWIEEPEQQTMFVLRWAT